MKTKTNKCINKLMKASDDILDLLKTLKCNDDESRVKAFESAFNEMEKALNDNSSEYLKEDEADPVKQIHDLCNKNRITPILIEDEDFTAYYESLELSEGDLDKLRKTVHDSLMEQFGNIVEQSLIELGYDI